MVDRTEEIKLFLGKYCKLELRKGFMLYGVPIRMDEDGFLFKTKEQISWINWNNVNSLALYLKDPKED